MAKKFYNPYHFVPVSAPSDAQKHAAIGREDLKRCDRAEHVTHERYVPGTLSGRVVVRVTTVTPVVLGGEQERKGKGLATVKPYKVNGRPAIPGSTLRGMAGAVMEAASSGPLRILDDRVYSYRRKMEGALSAIGMLSEEGGELRLRPMCLPTLESHDGGRSFEAPPRFRKIFPKPQFKILYWSAREIRAMDFAYRTVLGLEQAAPLPVRQLEWQGNKVLLDEFMKVKKDRSERPRFLLGQEADQTAKPRMGVVRVLGCWGDREKDMPHTKKHELWLPVPEGKSCPILPEALERFHQLADERTEEDPRLPFEPRDTARNADPAKYGDKLRLKAGDMVYFDVNDKGEVTELALSAIWRGRVEDPKTHAAATTHKFVEEVDSELLPFGTGRKKVSVAEQMLGFAEEVSEAEEKREDGGLALASRLRFSDGILKDGVDGNAALEAGPVALRILSSPKPPCPAMYFRARTGEGKYIEKAKLNLGEHQIQGRKWYLHGRSVEGEAPWKTEKPQERQDQKNLVRPVRRGQEFYFHVDFQNLRLAELGLLLYALEPQAGFHHKIGMGKPLGLGSVKLDVLGCFLVDRGRRYSVAGLQAGRYHEAEVTEAGRAVMAAGAWPAAYGEEAGGAAGRAVMAEARKSLGDEKLVSAEADGTLRVLGDYSGAPMARDVQYPMAPGQKDTESELFRWFVFNDGHKENRKGMTPRSQQLPPLGRGGLQGLLELEWEK